MHPWNKMHNTVFCTFSPWKKRDNRVITSLHYPPPGTILTRWKSKTSGPAPYPVHIKNWLEPPWGKDICTPLPLDRCQPPWWVCLGRHRTEEAAQSNWGHVTWEWRLGCIQASKECPEMPSLLLFSTWNSTGTGVVHCGLWPLPLDRCSC